MTRSTGSAITIWEAGRQQRICVRNKCIDYVRKKKPIYMDELPEQTDGERDASFGEVEMRELLSHLEERLRSYGKCRDIRGSHREERILSLVLLEEKTRRRWAVPEFA